jgi:hypothetical protein
MSKYRTVDLICRAWVPEEGKTAYRYRCANHGKEIELGGEVVCFEHRIQLEKDGCLRMYYERMLVEDK